MLWENKYKADYELICNGLFATIYQILFGEEAQCISPKGQRIVKQYEDWYMTLDGVYIKIIDRTNAPHWLPHFVPDTVISGDCLSNICEWCGYFSSSKQEWSLASISSIDKSL